MCARVLNVLKPRNEPQVSIYEESAKLLYQEIDYRQVCVRCCREGTWVERWCPGALLRGIVCVWRRHRSLDGAGGVDVCGTAPLDEGASDCAAHARGNDGSFPQVSPKFLRPSPSFLRPEQ
jgi:hypothetical protein